MAIELSLDGIKDMKKADFIKGFKNKAVWKKAKAVIILVDYKLEGKKAFIAIPFKKETDMKAEMKRLKKEKLHLLKKSGGGSIVFNKTPEGMSAKIEITIGGLAPELLLLKGQPMFSKIKVTLEALQSAEAIADAAEAAATETGEDPNDKLEEDNFEDVDDSEIEEEEEDTAGEVASGTLSEEQTKMKEDMNVKMAKIETKINEIKSQLKMT